MHEKMNAYTVLKMANILRVNDPSILNPVGKRLMVESNPTCNTNKPHIHKDKP